MLSLCYVHEGKYKEKSKKRSKNYRESAQIFTAHSEDTQRPRRRNVWCVRHIGGNHCMSSWCARRYRKHMGSRQTAHEHIPSMRVVAPPPKSAPRAPVPLLRQTKRENKLTFFHYYILINHPRLTFTHKNVQKKVRKNSQICRKRNCHLEKVPRKRNRHPRSRWSARATVLRQWARTARSHPLAPTQAQKKYPSGNTF